MGYSHLIRQTLESLERRVFQKLNSPIKIQDFLDTLPINYETKGETYMSPRRVMRHKTAHCFEGALLAAAALAYHGHRPLLIDFQTTHDDEDHVVAVFKINGRWGAISKTNHTILRYRDPVYLTPRELALSYFHEYFMEDGRKSMRTYSEPFDLSRYKLEEWLTAEDDLIDIVNDLDDSPHCQVMSKKQELELRKADSFELRTLQHTQWSRRGKRR